MNRRTRSSKPTPKKNKTPAELGAVQAASRADVQPPTPQWFSWALAEPVESLKVPVEDEEDGSVDIHCLRWGSSSKNTKRGLVLVHGGGATAHWYRFIAPFFASEFDVVAITNSGNGDSGLRKASYSLKNWSKEILVCSEKLGLLRDDRPRPYIVAHSLGSYVTVNLLRGVDFPDACAKFGGVIFADNAIRPYELSKTVHEQVLELRSKDPNMKPRTGWNINPPSITPFSRFKLRPYQECDNAYIVSPHKHHKCFGKKETNSEFFHR